MRSEQLDEDQIREMIKELPIRISDNNVEKLAKLLAERCDISYKEGYFVDTEDMLYTPPSS